MLSSIIWGLTVDGYGGGFEELDSTIESWSESEDGGDVEGWSCVGGIIFVGGGFITFFTGRGERREQV